MGREEAANRVFTLPIYSSYLKPGNFRPSEEDSVLYMDQAKLQTFHTLLRQQTRTGESCREPTLLLCALM